MTYQRGRTSRPVTIKLNNRPYSVTCETGQETRLMELAAHADQRVQQAAIAAQGSSDAQQLALATLLLADEVLDLRKELADLREGQAPAAMHMQMHSAANGAAMNGKANDKVISAVNKLAKRVEDIAAKLERA